MIGPAEPTDAAAIARVDLACRPMGPEPGSHSAGEVATLSHIWKARLEQDPRSVTVLRDELDVIGFVWAGSARDPDQDPGRTANVYAFCIAPGASDLAAASGLWTAVRRWLVAQEYRDVTARVDAADRRA